MIFVEIWHSNAQPNFYRKTVADFFQAPTYRFKTGHNEYPITRQTFHFPYNLIYFVDLQKIFI